MSAQAIATEMAGAGPPLVALHGWGGGRRSFEPVAATLSAHRRLVRVDLPGCGGSRPDLCGGDLEAIAAAVLRSVPQPATWLGWSLGGLVSLAAARQAPAAVGRIVLVSASPCFVAGPGWPGTDAGLLDAFAEQVARDPAGAHARFLGLQLAGSEGARRALRALRAAAAADGLPERATLAAGLELLRGTDFRGLPGELSCPVAAILGGADPLLPPEVAPRLRDDGVAVTVIPGAGHAPFASHADAFIAALLE